MELLASHYRLTKTPMTGNGKEWDFLSLELKRFVF